MSANRSSRRRLLGATALAGALSMFVAGQALAESPPIQFDQPAQPLAQALRSYSAVADQEIMFADALVAGRTAPPLKGAYTPEGALMALLDGTGLTVSRTTSGVLLVQRASDPQSGSAAGDGAEGTVQALIVTAQKREENIQDVPIAMSAFTQEDLTKSQVAGGPDLMTQVPNFTFTKTNFSGYSIQIRGIGTQAISATTDPAVAVAFNNTPFIRNRFFEQEFYDLERVEVLRGPQGTLYGRNATAGVVNIISAKPKDHFEARLSADVSNYNSTRLEGMINLPLVQDKAALRIAGAWTKRDGFVKNILTGQQTDGRDLWSTRVTLGLTPSDKFSANLIYEHFSENDDRLRSGKQLCRKDLGPAEIDGVPTSPVSSVFDPASASYFSQGCLPASLYSPDSFQTPNGYSLPYYGALAGIGAPVYATLDPYVHSTQSRNLREIETHIKPDYEASNDTVELQLKVNLPHDLTLASETGFNRDHIFSFEDYNRFDTTPGVFAPGDSGFSGIQRYDIVDQNGVFCDPQLGCTDRLAAGDLSTAHSKQFSQEFRVSSDFDGVFNFSVGANFLRYDTEDKYYVFINSVAAYEAGRAGTWDPTNRWPNDNSYCFYGMPSNDGYLKGFAWSDPNQLQGVGGSCAYIDTNNIHNLNDQGRNYFLSKNPYHLLSYAAFGEAYWQVTPALKITAGLRWTDDRKTAPQIPSWLLADMTYGTMTRKVIHQEWREPTGRLAVDYKPSLAFTDQTLLYASFVRGYKAGGANPPPPVVLEAPVGPGIPFSGVLAASLTHPETFKPEFVDAFEVGTKNTLLEGRLTFNLNGFYYDYTGYQISEIVDRSAVNLNFDAKIWGSELEVDWRLLENLQLGFKGGYEHTEMAKGSQAIDLMDRTAGNPNYIIKRPFPTIPSNCIVPVDNALYPDCAGYYAHSYDAWNVPNNGEGIAKDLSGNELPNAPKFTATITADYTIPLPNDWLATLHTDLYYQAEAWTRIFNDPGYDKLKAYSNVNLAAILSNEDRGWQVMAYVKNALNKDNITGAFLNSDDTGLTTNVFLNEPRLYGIRVTKNWTDSPWWSAHANHSGWYPYRLEFNGDYGRFDQDHEILTTVTTSLFPKAHPYPLDAQRDLDWGSTGGVKLTYQPTADSWSISGDIRYGHAAGNAAPHSTWAAPGGMLFGPYTIAVAMAKFPWLTPEAAQGWLAMWNHYVPARGGNYTTAQTSNGESHAIADFTIGKDVGLGEWKQSASTFSASLRYAQFTSDSKAILHGRPDFADSPEDVSKYGGNMHRINADMDAHRRFRGAGIVLNWEIKARVVDLRDAGSVDLNAGIGGGALLGSQDTKSHGQSIDDYIIRAGVTQNDFFGTPGVERIGTTTSLEAARSNAVTVPIGEANLGLIYNVGGLKVSTGYRWERYYNVIDGGILTRKAYDRQFDGPYFKVSIGFGG